MNLQHFPAFMRANFPEISDENNEVLLKVGAEFKKFLQNKFAGREETLENIWDIDPKTVIMHQVNKNPFMVKGYHPTFVVNFSLFIQEIMQSQTPSPSACGGSTPEGGEGGK